MYVFSMVMGFPVVSVLNVVVTFVKVISQVPSYFFLESKSFFLQPKLKSTRSEKVMGKRKRFNRFVLGGAMYLKERQRILHGWMNDK